MWSPIHQAAAASPTAVAIINGHAHLSYHTVSQRVQALARQLSAAGLQSGQPLACIANNCLELILLYWACVDTGIIFSPLSPRFPDAQLDALLDRFNIQYLWCPDANRSALWQQRQRLQPDFNAEFTAHIATIDPLKAVNLVCTSGSSGLPKAAVHSLHNHIANAEGSRQLISLHCGDGWLASLPLFHIGGLAILNRCALVAATVVLPDSQLSLAQQLQRDPISHLSLVATQLQRLLDDDCASLKRIRYLLLGGGAISQSLLDQLTPLQIQAFTSYGMTEMGSQITTGLARSDGSSGQLLPGRALQIRQQVIWVKGETLFMGYLQADGSLQRDTDPEGWFCTQDRGYLDNEARLHIQGRVDNMFICGGENLQPEEVENALKLHPQILEAVVFGETDREFGLLPAAIIKPRTLPVNTAELSAFLADKIARFKRPRHYYLWPEQQAQGLKIQRKQIIAAVVAAPLAIDSEQQ